MKNIVSFAVRYPVTIAMLVLGVLLLGFISLDKLGIELFPNLNNPRLFVEVKVGERPPEEVEKQFVEGIESVAIRQKGALEVTSLCKSGIGRVTVQYAWDMDMDEAFLDLQKALSSFSQNEDIDELNISQFDPNASPILIVGLFHPEINNFNELRKTAEHNVKNELIRLEGVADVKIAGQQEKEVVIETDPNLLAAYGLTVDIIVTKIQNYNRSVSGGSIEELGKKYIIKGTSILENVEDIKNIVVGFANNNQSQDNSATTTSNVSNNSVEKRPVLLQEVAQVNLVDHEASNIVRINGKRSLGLSIYKETKFNTVKAVDQLQDALADLQKALPGYEFMIVQNQGEFIQEAIDEVKESGLLGAAFAIIILFVFLKRIGTTTIVSVAIPISIVATFNLMFFNGLTLNVMTLGGLALGAGMLVDNAIIVMENIFRNREEGLSIKEAAIKGTSEVGGAIAASTLTTIIVFLPIVYVQGASGELFKDQAWTVAFSLLSSLVVAILVIPALFSNIFKKEDHHKEFKSIKFNKYGKLLHAMLNHKWKFIGLAVIMVVGAFLLIPLVGSEYMPRTDTKSLAISLTLPEGTKLQRTQNTVIQIESQLETIFPNELELIYSHIGVKNTTNDGTENLKEENLANLKVVIKDESEISVNNIVSVMSQYLEEIPGMKVQFSNDESALEAVLGTDEAPLIIEVKGNDIATLKAVIQEVEGVISTLPEIYNVKSSLSDQTPQVDIKIDKYRAGLYNISTESISGQIKDKLSGKDAGKLEQAGEMQDILIKIPETSLSELGNMTIKNGQENIRIDEIAQINSVLSPNAIDRRNQNRIATLSAQIGDDTPFDRLVVDIKGKLNAISLPPGYSIDVVGEELKRKESVKNLSFALWLSVILVYMVLASQFESLIHPFTILLTIPLAGVGAIFTFFLLGQPLNIMALIGIIMLTGIAVNDSIIFVDAINQFKRQGYQIIESIVAAGQKRIRPIIMTSLTTILALLPLTFGFGESASLRSPMAWAVIGGLITSTLLTLVIIPCVYLAIENGWNKISGKNNSMVAEPIE